MRTRTAGSQLIELHALRKTIVFGRQQICKDPLLAQSGQFKWREIKIEINISFPLAPSGFCRFLFYIRALLG